MLVIVLPFGARKTAVRRAGEVKARSTGSNTIAGCGAGCVVWLCCARSLHAESISKKTATNIRRDVGGNLSARVLVEAQAFRKKEERVALIAGDSASDGKTRASRRVLVAGVVVVAHIALIASIGRGIRRPAEVVEVFLTLIPVTTEEQPSQPVRSPELPSP